MILWLDLETDGAEDYRKGNILEIGAVLTTENLTMVESYSEVLFAPERVLNRMPEIVRDMHKKSGLWDEVLLSEQNIYHADFLLSEMIQNNTDEKVAIAGTGVLHYDLKWVNHHMHRTGKLLHYWGYDSGVVRRVMRDLVGADVPGKETFVTGTSHRALDDVLGALNEMDYYVETLRG